RWTSVDADQYARESKLVGDPERFGAVEPSPNEGIVRPASGSAAELLDLLEQERDEKRDEPLWKGVQSMAADGNGVRIRFTERVEPRLLPVAGTTVEVACHLHHDPSASA
ncbi:MAG TPA: hypothetical protein VE287_11740, partial [Actinopolymorphaceae bacterium]|nr:hypothetical protein [Actinopolymorphaceae bacterium]